MYFVASIVVPTITPLQAVNLGERFRAVSPDGVEPPHHLSPATTAAGERSVTSPPARRLVQDEQFVTASPRQRPLGGPMLSNPQLTALRI